MTTSKCIPLSSRDALTTGGDDRSDLERSLNSRLSSTEATSEESSLDPRREDSSEVELDLAIGVTFEDSSKVDQVLDGGSVDVGDSTEIEDDSAEDRFGSVLLSDRKFTLDSDFFFSPRRRTGI